MTRDFAESEVTAILADPFAHEWTIQGFGMLRTYLDAERVSRLHIWDAEQAVPDVSTIHDHPWDFRSRIYRGTLRNQRYFVNEDPSQPVYHAARIQCGVGGGLIATPDEVHVRALAAEVYAPGDAYGQEATEFHESIPSRGAVTVITRSFKADRDVATVCWMVGEWVSAEPRPATKREVEHFVELALRG